MSHVDHSAPRTAHRRLGYALGAAAAALVTLLPTAAPASAASGSNWDGWICDESNQYRINTPSGMVLDLSQGPDNPGAILQHPYLGGKNQKWLACRWPSPTQSTDWVFRSVLTRQCITMVGYKPDDGQAFQQGDCGDYIGTNQKFWLDRHPVNVPFAMQVLHSGAWVSIQKDKFAQQRALLVQYSDKAMMFSLQVA
ncbi:RICIN domain-containing protein [Streptomyces sp. NPDC050504]|uniref:RICIN domain-containing protein n=1 Tax=Streptomyces sp. NPDC050504 TaxID=3365618 RepID=UPI00378F7533